MNEMAKEIKILLVNPGKLLYAYPPLGLGYISSYLKKYGKYNYDIKLADENAQQNAIGIIKEYNPEIIGITSTTPQINEALKIANFAKARDGKSLVIIGGPHPTVLPNQTLEAGRCIDIVCIGEGEVTFKELVDTYIENGNTEFYIKLSNIKGIAYKDTDGQNVIVNEPRPFIENLDDVPLPDRDLFDANFYFKKQRQVIRGIGKRSTHLMSSRGCPFHCTYCASNIIWKRKFRFHSSDRVIEEIDILVNKYGIEALFFEDDLLIANRKRLIEICEKLIKTGLSEKIVWATQMKADLVRENDLDLLKLMKDAGCIQLDYGFESGSDRILKIVKNGSVTVSQNQIALDISKKAGLRVFGNFILGFQGETLEDMLLTKKFILSNFNKIDYYQVFIATPYPGTVLWNDCIKEKIINDINDAAWNGFGMGVLNKRVFSNTVTEKEILEIVDELNFLAFKKIPMFEKITWFYTRISDDPKYVYNMAYDYLIQKLKRV